MAEPRAGVPLRTKPPRELIEFLYPHDPAIQSLALGLRHVVLEELAPCHEYIFAMGPKVVLTYSSSERVIKDNICAISVFTKHVNLGFSQGAKLKNVARILEGNGASWRHLKVRALSDLDRREIRTCLREARKHAGLKRPRVRTPEDVKTRVKTTASKRAARQEEMARWPWP